jgi:hypothetical protein
LVIPQHAQGVTAIHWISAENTEKHEESGLPWLCYVLLTPGQEMTNLFLAQLQNVNTPGVPLLIMDFSMRPRMKSLILLVSMIGASVTLVLAFWYLILAHEMSDDIWSREQAIVAIEKRGGEVKRHFDKRRGVSYEVNLAHKGFKDADLVCLKRIPNLQAVWLGGNPISNSGLRHLRSIPSIEFIGLAQTQVSDEGFEYLQGLPNLRVLSIWGTAITDKGLVFLANCKKLESLDISDTAVGDTGLALLKSLPRLRAIRLARTLVTNKGMSAFHKHRPEVELVYE